MGYPLDSGKLVMCVTLWQNIPPMPVAASMRGLCDRGQGSWTPPGASPGETAATHLHEISLYGVTASGDSPEETACNWLRAARNVLEASASAA